MTGELGRTRDWQHLAVSEGLALGCVHRRVAQLTGQREPLAIVTMLVWPRWPYHQAFDQVQATYIRNDFTERILVAPDWMRQACGASWLLVPAARGRPRQVQPHLKQGYTLDEASAQLQTDTGIPLADWSDLAGILTETLGPARVHYYHP